MTSLYLASWSEGHKMLWISRQLRVRNQEGIVLTPNQAKHVRVETRLISVPKN
jgi:hypothetical protein